MHVNQWNRAGADLGGGVGKNFTIIAAKLKQAGYATHQLGKWHCGQSSADLVPAGRGFDSSLGYLNGAEDHFNQRRVACGTTAGGGAAVAGAASKENAAAMIGATTEELDRQRAKRQVSRLQRFSCLGGID